MPTLRQPDLITPNKEPRSTGRLAVLALVAGFILSATAISVAAAQYAPAKGPIPDAAVRSNGEIVDGLVPDYVSVVDRNGEIAGYVRKELVIGDPGDAPWPVFAADLKTLVGRMVPGRGFVPLGVDERAVPTFEVEVGHE